MSYVNVIHGRALRFDAAEIFYKELKLEQLKPSLALALYGWIAKHPRIQPAAAVGMRLMRKLREYLTRRHRGTGAQKGTGVKRGD